MSLAHPQALLLLLFLPLAYWPLRTAHRGSALFSTLAAVRGARCAGWARWGPWLLAHLRALALLLLVLALARPQSPDGQSPLRAEGIAIQLVMDTSLSMGYVDYLLDKNEVSRLDAARNAVRVFVQGDAKHGLAGRPNDLIGLVGFNRYPDVACPLTTSHDSILAALDELELGPYTNIGDGLVWGLDRLRAAPTKEKVVILLSDGKHNAPEGTEPLEAGQLAAELGIRVYAIGAVGNRGRSGLEVVRLGNSYVRVPPDSVDEDALKKLAGMTGGKYFRATDADGLLAIYREIDQLEKTRITQTESVPQREWYVWFAAAGLILLALEQTLAATRVLMVA